MDFSLSDEQKAMAELAARIFSDRCTLARLKVVETREPRYDAELWSELARAGLLGAALPESVGGSGGGFLEICQLLEQQGRRVAPVPLLATLVSGAMAISRFGSPEQQERWLAGVADGQRLLSAALTEPGGDAFDPRAVAVFGEEGWHLSGIKSAVPVADRAEGILVPARIEGGEIGLFVVDPSARGVRLAREEVMSLESQFRLELDDVRVGPDAILGSIERGGEILSWVVERTVVGACAIVAGVCQEATRITAEYASNRKQFDKPIAMFQAVGQRMADCYIDNEAVSLTMWQAATRLAEEKPATREVAIAKYWAAEGGSRIGHAALHVHGGISIDVDYPIHRYFQWAKQMEFTLGAATAQLARLGRLLADSPDSDGLP